MSKWQTYILIFTNMNKIIDYTFKREKSNKQNTSLHNNHMSLVLKCCL